MTAASASVKKTHREGDAENTFYVEVKPEDAAAIVAEHW
jgi:(2Fe-2S) ferredoxin